MMMRVKQAEIWLGDGIPSLSLFISLLIIAALLYMCVYCVQSIMCVYAAENNEIQTYEKNRNKHKRKGKKCSELPPY